MVMRYTHLATEHLQSHADILDTIHTFGHKMDISEITSEKENRLNDCLDGVNLVGRERFERSTNGLKVRCSTD